MSKINNTLTNKELGKIKKSGKSRSDFHLDKKHYRTLKELKIFATEKRVAKIFGVQSKKTEEKFINIKSKSKKPFGWKFNIGVSLYNTFPTFFNFS